MPAAISARFLSTLYGVFHMQRENQMQFLRVLAFFNIFLLHAGHWNLFQYPSWFGAISAVSFFFMLSGFLTGFSFEEVRLKTGIRACAAYMKRKVLRFYPLYALVTVYAISFSPIPQIFASGHFAELIDPVIQLARNLLCIQCWFPDGFFSYYGPAWFSAALLFLTALNLPFLALIRRLRRTAHSRLLLCGLSVLFFAGTALYCYLTRDTFLQFTHYILPLSRVGIYLGSMVLGILLRPVVLRAREQDGHAPLFTLLEAASLVVWVVSLRFPGPAWMEWNVSWILPNLLVLAAFSFGKGGLSRLFSCRPLVSLGNVTMECYLVHKLIISSYSRYNQFDTTYTLGCLFSLAACFALTFAVSFMLHARGSRRA